MPGTEIFRGKPAPSSGMKWTFIGKFEAPVFSAQGRSQDLKMGEWKVGPVWSRVKTHGMGDEKKV
jgi:hypothetical protein